MTSIKQGCIDIWIDEIVPCLKDTQTGKKLLEVYHYEWNET